MRCLVSDLEKIEDGSRRRILRRRRSASSEVLGDGADKRQDLGGQEVKLMNDIKGGEGYNLTRPSGRYTFNPASTGRTVI